VLLTVASAVVLFVVPSITQAATYSKVAIASNHTVTGSPSTSPTTICDKVSAITVSTIIGYQEASVTSDTLRIKPTKANFEESGSVTACTYGSMATEADAFKTVTLMFEIFSKPLTMSEEEKSLARMSGCVKCKYSAFKGLGVPAIYTRFDTAQGIFGELGSTRYFGAHAWNGNVSASKLAVLAKLAERL
jgi:hypothetical protein